MGRVLRFDHVGVTVVDLDLVSGFFQRLGLVVQGDGQWTLEGEFLDTVTGLHGARVEAMMLAAPGGGTTLELTRYIRPAADSGFPMAMANVAGLRSLAFEVEDLQETVQRLAEEGYPLVGGVGEHEQMWRMAYVRGPESIIVALAQRIG